MSISTKKTGLMLVVSGPSGVGKTTICNELCRRIPNLVRSVSATTRPKRDGEIDGQHYHFLSKEIFLQKVTDGEFLEYAQVHQHYYGTLKKTVDNALQSGYHCLLEIDTQGAKTIRSKKEFQPLFIFIAPPDIKILYDRLVKRGSENSDTIKIRLAKAQNEMAEGKNYDCYVENVDLEKTITQVQTIIELKIGSSDVLRETVTSGDYHKTKGV